MPPLSTTCHQYQRPWPSRFCLYHITGNCKSNNQQTESHQTISLLPELHHRMLISVPSYQPYESHMNESWVIWVTYEWVMGLIHGNTTRHYTSTEFNCLDEFQSRHTILIRVTESPRFMALCLVLVVSSFGFVWFWVCLVVSVHGVSFPTILFQNTYRKKTSFYPSCIVPKSNGSGAFCPPLNLGCG